MNQDSDKNENRRDGDTNRSYGRRDDGNTHKSGTSRPGNTRSNDADRPRFGRNDRPGHDRPSFSRDNRPGSNRPGTEKPAFNRTDGPRNDRPRTDGPAGRPDRPRGDQNRNDRPGSTGGSPFRGRPDADRNRSDRSTGSPRPSFGRDRNDSDRNRPGDARPRFDKPRDERDGAAKPRFERSDERPRFEHRRDSDRSRTGGDTPRPQPFERDQKRERPSGDARPRFPRESNDRQPSGSAGRSRDKPAGRAGASSPASRFKRVGGFSRDADERNRENWSAPDKRDGKEDTPSSRNTRFSAEQRKDSGDRRTGFFVKAPNYELEQQRQPGFKRPERSGPATPRPRTDRYADKPRPNEEAKLGSQNEKPARTPGDSGTTRLNRYIANSGVCSRREADELIAQGDISVNGKTVTEMGFRVKEGDMVKYGTKALTPERFVYVLLNKPKDYITTTEDPEERKTVMELVADAGNFRMYPVGRLDRKTTGLLLLTNDGELADKLTHPSNNVRKIYQVELDKPITEAHFDAIKKGLELEDGPIKPDALSIVTPDAYVVGIEIHSGRNRIVRRIFESLGYDVTKLDRTAYSGLTKKELPRGKWRFLDPKEVVKLKYLS